MSVNAIIVGPPRSGTSMTAVIFKRNGYFVTDDEVAQLQQANEFNPYGFWEAEALKKANAEIFHSVGFEFDNTWMFNEISDQQVEGILSLPHAENHKRLVEEYSQHAPWLWKDPCLCFTIGYWWPLLKEHNTRVILLKRDPKEIYQSFLRLKWNEMNGDDKQAAHKRIEHHLVAAEEALKRFDIPHIVINYADYASDSEATARKIGDFFELDLCGKDIGYDEKLRTSGFRGAYWRLLDGLGGFIPDGLRKNIKKLMPGFIMKIIYPHRYLNK